MFGEETESILDRKGVPKCDNCDESGDLPQAIGYCENCNDYLCQKCLEYHKKLKALCDHIIFRITESKQDLKGKGHQDITDQKCNLHSRYFVEFYCQDHDQVGCANCHLIDHKSCENVTYLREVNQDILCSTQVNEHISTLKELQHEAECIENEVKKHETKLNENTMDCITNMQDVRNKIDDQVNTLHTRALDQVKHINETNAKVLKTVLDKCGEIKGTITEQIDEIEKNIEHGHARNMYVSLKRRDAVIKSIKDIVKKTAADNNVKLYKYICDPQLQISIFEDTERFGVLEEIVDGSDEAGRDESREFNVLTNKQMIVSLRHEVDDTSKALKEIEEHNAALDKELQLTKEVMEEENNDLKNQLAMKEKHVMETAQSAADMELSYSQTIEKLKRELNSLETKNKQQEMQIKHLEEATTKSPDSQRALQDEIRNLKFKCQQQEEKSQRWKDKFSKAEDTLQQKHLDMTSIKTRLVQASEHITEVGEGNTRLPYWKRLYLESRRQYLCRHCKIELENKKGGPYCSTNCAALALKTVAVESLQEIIKLFDTI